MAAAQDNIAAALRLAFAHHQAGRFDFAEQIYRQILAAQPNHPYALHLLGVLALQRNQLAPAADLLQRAITARPDFPDPHYYLGVVFDQLGRTDEAIACYRRACQLKPDYAEAHGNLGIALAEKREFIEGIDHLRRAAELAPDSAQAHYNLARALTDGRRLEESLPIYHRALALQPHFPQALSALGTTHFFLGQLDQAVECQRRALAQDSNLSEGHWGMGAALQQFGQFDEAMSYYDRALALNPFSADAHWHRATALLLHGDFERGWQEFEWRFNWKNYPVQSFAQPRWDGSPLGGRTILVHAEQGLGDVIHFARYIPLIAGRAGGARVIVEALHDFERIFKSLDGVDEFIPRGKPIPRFDVHLPLMSAPLLFNTTVETVPSKVPYLKPDGQAIEAWRNVVPAEGKLKVGLVWAGNARHSNDRDRSIPLADFAPLARVPGVVFHTLQKGDATFQAKNPPPGMKLFDWTPRLLDLADTAALIQHLDVVISVDTSVAHLAGALGKPVWIMLPFVPDWRWMLHREDSPWYPTARLFRQPRIGDWRPVIARLAEALASFGPSEI